MRQIERVGCSGVIRERDGQVVGQRLGHEAVDRFVQARVFILSSPRDDERQTRWERT